MNKELANVVVEQLTAWNVPAAVAPLGLHSSAVRVRLGAGREALWDADGAAGLSAQVLRDGVLVGYLPELPDSAGLPAGHTAWLIATADYDLSPPGRPDLVRPVEPAVVGVAVRPAAAACYGPSARGECDRDRGGGAPA
ncbi:MAG: hypothetical protein JWN77_1118 [Frankiales bacterium]|jgi:hypothetical protein|nr:hypothetical protein [Frankiales bacterium]